MLKTAPMPRTGRPPKDSTANAKSMLRFQVPNEVAEAIRERQEASGLEMMPFLARTVCEALGIKLPPPGKRGPKPRT